MKKLIFVLLFAFNASAEVIESSHYSDVLKYLTADTLFVTDLDNTVVRPPQTLGSDQWGSALQKDLIAKGYTKDQAADLGVSLFGLIQMKTAVIPVEVDTPAIIKKIAIKGVPTLALTARPLVIVDRTLKQLNSIGVILTGIAEQDVSFGNGTVEYKSGVLFVGPHNNKGEILKTFLAQNKMTWVRRIVFIDDKAHHTADMDAAFANSGIEVKAVRYGATDEIVKNYDAALAQKQFEIFGRTGRIVSDEEAGK